MSYKRFAKGTINKITHGDCNLFAEKKISFFSGNQINISSDAETNYGNADSYSKNLQDITEELPKYIMYEVINNDKVVIYSQEGHRGDYTKNPFQGDKIFYLPEIIYVRFSRTNEITGTSYYIPNNDTLSAVYPYNAGMFQPIGSIDWRGHEKALNTVLYHFFNLYYPNSVFNSSVLLHKESAASDNEATRAYTAKNPKDNWFFDDEINPHIVFLLDNNGRLENSGQRNKLYDILATIYHEY